MKYINPLEILEVDNPESSNLKKAKRRKMAEIELSDDGSIDYGRRKITKSDFIGSVDELDDPRISEYYSWLKQNGLLSAFLREGRLDFFETNIPNRFLQPHFLDFITPYFAPQFDATLKKAIQQKDLYTIILLTQNPPLVKRGSVDTAYKTSVKVLPGIAHELQELRNNIDNGTLTYSEHDNQQVLDTLESIVSPKVLNALPAYFEGFRNEIAEKIKNFSVAIFNKLDEVSLALDVLEYALGIRVSGLTKAKFNKDYEQLKDIKEERDKVNKYAKELLSCALEINTLKEIIESTEEKEISIDGIKSKLGDFLDVPFLNRLPSEVFLQIRNQYAIGLKVISVNIWNNYHSLSEAINLVNIALSIDTDYDTRKDLEDALSQLKNLEREAESNERKELEQLYDIVRKINMEISTNSALHLNQDSIQELLDNVLPSAKISMLASSSSKELVTKLVGELIKLSKSLQPIYGKAFLNRLLPIASSDIFLYSKIKDALPLVGSKYQRDLEIARQNNSGGCYIATACYGSYDATEVLVFRQFRDNYLQKYFLGRCFIKTYYKISPPLADRLKSVPTVNRTVRAMILNPIYKTLKNRCK